MVVNREPKLSSRWRHQLQFSDALPYVSLKFGSRSRRFPRYARPRLTPHFLRALHSSHIEKSPDFW